MGGAGWRRGPRHLGGGGLAAPPAPSSAAWRRPSPRGSSTSCLAWTRPDHRSTDRRTNPTAECRSQTRASSGRRFPAGPAWSHRMGDPAAGPRDRPESVTTPRGIMATPPAALLRSWGRPSRVHRMRREALGPPPGPLPRGAGRRPSSTLPRTARFRLPCRLSYAPHSKFSDEGVIDPHPGAVGSVSVRDRRAPTRHAWPTVRRGRCRSPHGVGATDGIGSCPSHALCGAALVPQVPSFPYRLQNRYLQRVLQPIPSIPDTSRECRPPDSGTWSGTPRGYWHGSPSLPGRR